MNVLTKIFWAINRDGQTATVQVFDYKIFILFILIMIIIAVLTKLTGASQERKSATWGCGIELNADMEYTAASFFPADSPGLQPFAQAKKKDYYRICQPTLFQLSRRF